MSSDSTESLSLEDIRASEEKCTSRPLLKDLSSLVTPEYAAKWRAIGESLGFTNGALDIINSDWYGTENCCNRMFGRWLDTDINASWGNVISAVDAAMAQGPSLPSDVLSIVKGKCEKEHKEVSDDAWPPYQPEFYTTLALIHHKDKVAHKKAVLAVAKKAYKGKVTSQHTTKNGHNDEAKSTQKKNSYLSGCTYITNVSDIFPADSACKPYTLLIEGAPGIGKTILSKEIAFLWASQKILKDTKLLVLIYLRDPHVHKISNYYEFAQYITSTHQKNTMIKSFRDYLFDACGKDIMFVFDGYDELPESLRQESFIANIIYRNKFPSSKIVITSRPSASAHLHKKAECRIEILGFTDEDRRTYISQALNTNPEQIKNIFTYLENNPVINSLCYIPLNMSILICLLKELDQNELPKNQTEINNRFICMTISRHLKKENKIAKMSSLNNIPVEYKGQLKELSELAFTLLGKNKIVFNNTDGNVNSPLFSKNSSGMGLLKAVKHFSSFDNCELVSYNFSHFSLQEFLAAYHIASSTHEVQKNIMREKFWCERYLNTWIMYFGLTKSDSLPEPLEQFLSGHRSSWLDKFKIKSQHPRPIDETFIQDKIKCLHLFQCFSEAGNETMCQKVGSFLNEFIIDLSGQPITSREMHTLTFFLTRSANKEWESLILSNCYIDDQSFKILTKSCLSDQANNLSINTLDFSSSSITLSSLHEICKVVLCLKVQKLIILNNSISDEDVSTTLFSIVNTDSCYTFSLPLTVVTSLGSMNSISCSLDSYSDSKSFENMTSVYVINCECSQALQNLNKGFFTDAQHLFLWNSSLKIDDFIMISRDNASLLMSIVHTNLNDDEIDNLHLDFQKQFASNNNVNADYIFKSEKQLLIFGADIQLLFKNSFIILSVLQVTNCSLTIDGLNYLGKTISNNRINWEIVELSNCGITDEGFSILCSHFPGIANTNNSNVAISIKIFNVSNNCLTSSSIKTIKDSLTTCVIDQYIISCNDISQQDLSIAFIVELHTQFVSANFVQKHPLIIINDANSKQLKLNCNVYIINCTIDATVFETVLKNQWKINELSLAYNDFYKDKLDLFTSFLPNLQVVKLTLLQTGISDEVAMEAVVKLKNFTKVEYVLFSQTKLLCYQTCDKQIVKIILHHPTNVVNDLQITDCHFGCNELLKFVLNKCSSKLQFIDFTGSSIKDKGCMILHAYLTSADKPLHLKVLNLTRNNLTSSSIVLLNSILHSCVIKRLIIAHNDLDFKELHNAILTETQLNSKIRNFNCNIPLTVIGSRMDCSGIHYHSKKPMKHAYIYFVNSAITKRTMEICNELSEQNILVHKLVFCNNRIIVKSDDLLSLSIDNHKFVNIKSINSMDSSEENIEVASVANHDKAEANRKCTFIYKGRLISFRIFHRQIVEVLSQRLMDMANLDTLQLINCTIPSSAELSQLGKIISSYKRQWKCIDFSGCNIGDQGCATLSRMCKDYTKIGDVTIKLLNLTNNGLTSSSLKDISSIVLQWKVEKVLTSCNKIHQYDLCHTISAMAKLEIYKQYLFQIEVGSACRSIVIHNHSNCKQYLLKMLTLEKSMFGKMVSNNLIDSHQILRSSSIEPPLLQSYNTSSIALPELPQENITVISTVTVGKHDMKSYSFKKGMISYENFLYVTQEAKFIAPIHHIHVINSNITHEIACDVSETINSGKQLESIELVNNNIEEVDIIKIVTALQSTSLLQHFCVSNNVISNLAAQSFGLAISCNIFLENFHLSHCELREQGMLTIIKSLKMIKSLKHCDLSGNYITDKCATELVAVITNNAMLCHLKLANCKLQENGLFCIVDALKKASTLTYLDLSSNRINNESANLISNLIDNNKKLNHVDFSKCMLKEKGLNEMGKALSKLPSLNYVDLSFNEISNHVANILAPAFKHASYVFLNNCNLKRHGIEKISSVLEITSSLNELGICETSLTSPTIKALATTLTRNMKMNHLNIAACGFTEDDFQPILQAIEFSSSLKHLDISGNAFDSATSRNLAERIRRHNKLQHLQISNCSFEEDGLKYIFKDLHLNKRNFYYLDSSCNHISSDAARQLASTIKNIHTIKHLILHHCDLQEQGLIAISNALSNISCLRTLNLSYNKTSDKVASKLGKAIMLNNTFSHLEMVSCNLTEQGIITITNSLTKISSLTHLNISCNSINYTAADVLATVLMYNTSMQHLDLSYCNINESGLNTICKSLSETSKLTYLNLSDNKISNTVAEQLTLALKKISTLNYLILCNCEIQELGFDMILGILCGKNILHHLNVNQNIISDETAVKICKVTAASTFLTELEISSCNISGRGLRLIAESLLKDNKISLEHMNLSVNTIFSNAAESISNTFYANTSMEYLDLSHCKLGECEFRKICKSLSNNVLLTHFNVSHNSITDEVATEIASITKGNVTLQYVNFQNCNLRDNGIICIVDALCNVKTLRTFIASNNPAISHDSVKHIINVITSNTFLRHFDLSHCNLQELSTSTISEVAKKIATMKFLILDQY